MSAQPEVSAPTTPEGGPLRVRSPRPLSRNLRIALGVVAAVVVVAGAVLVHDARTADGGEIPGSGWSGPPVPRAARIDPFDDEGPLGEVDGFGTWRADRGTVVGHGVVTSKGVDDAVATVDAGSTDVLVHARVVQATPGGAIFVSASADGNEGLVLMVGQSGSDWELVKPGPGGSVNLLGTYDAPTSNIVVQVVRRGERVHVTLGTKGYDAKVPAGAADGTHVGIGFTLPGTEFDLFGYLPLPAG